MLINLRGNNSFQEPNLYCLMCTKKKLLAALKKGKFNFILIPFLTKHNILIFGNCVRNNFPFVSNNKHLENIDFSQQRSSDVALDIVAV